MKLSSESRLHKLETLHGRRDRCLVVVRGATPAEQSGEIKAMIRSGTATDEDIFIITGVPRSESFNDGIRG